MHKNILYTLVILPDCRYIRLLSLKMSVKGLQEECICITIGSVLYNIDVILYTQIPKCLICSL